MRIALVHPFAWPDVRRGGERYLDDLSHYLADAGHSVDVITGKRSPSSGSATLRRFGFGPVETFGVRAFPSLVGRRYDVVHALTPSAAVAARASRQRVLFTVLGLPEPEVFRRRPAQRRLFTTAIKRASAVAALSRPAADEVARGFGREAIVLPPGVRIERFPLRREARTGSPEILFASALDQRQKGLDVLTHAFVRVHEASPDVRLVLAGPGDPSWALADLPESSRNAIDVAGPGSPEELPSRYARASVTVLPSQHEAFGLVLVESLACGTPVVGAIPGGPSDVVDDGVGRLVPYGDAEALAAALADCMAMARDAETSERCRAHAMRWDWKTAIGPAHVAAYSEIARRNA
jgi:phosphatidylinositol alpha-mannosyltransferase